jgi:hypothetical protein
MQITGIDARRFLELLGAHPVLPRTPVGRLRIVAVDDLRALLARLALTSGDASTDELLVDEQPETADALLARIGMRKTGT